MPTCPDHDHLQTLATQIRRDAIRMIAANGSGHPGGALGAAEIFAVLYGHIMNHNPADPHRDRFVLSNGHICAALYSVLSRCGYLDPAELATFRRANSRLQGHPAHLDLPDLIETSTGPLGQGLSVANGLALAFKLDGNPGRIYCLVGDGEMQEGQIWEALMTASHYRLNNVTLIVSYNGLQIDGEIDAVKSIQPLGDKLRAFGWQVWEVDGHDIAALIQALEETRQSTRPSAIIAHTVMGKGVPFMEGKALWHGKAPSLEQAAEALRMIGKTSFYQDFPLAGDRL